MTVLLSHECAGVREAGRLVAWREHALGAVVPALSFPHWATAIIVALGVPGTIAGQRQMRAMNSEAGQKAVSYLPLSGLQPRELSPLFPAPTL